ncbi:DUF1033 family protein [Chryseomicrobium palamuruense]|uniref:DUF1033 family protein n=1 Tax=Chryseomicrobium palamuruense TaxID=682973 RepID=A0ABV8UTN0_9BACL
MYHVIYMKADYEPWYQFDGWQTKILDRWTFEEEDKAQDFLLHKVSEFRAHYQYSKEKNGAYAFWDVQEVCYCEDCEDNLQLYHGLLLIKEFAE